jgi:hypothetical protein
VYLARSYQQDAIRRVGAILSAQIRYRFFNGSFGMHPSSGRIQAWDAAHFALQLGYANRRPGVRLLEQKEVSTSTHDE